MATYLPTISNSLSVACFLIRLHMSIVNRVEALLKMDVNELITAAIITATIRPRMPVTYHRKHQVDINIVNIVKQRSRLNIISECLQPARFRIMLHPIVKRVFSVWRSLTCGRQSQNELGISDIRTPSCIIAHPQTCLWV